MDTSKSRKSEAAATRKRRSSILKSQRAPRTPFSELEFHVATPPDAAKSRRVSFSRRNGVAEFEITEATTAWKNVYEEHNKSLELSANESGGKGENATGRKVDYLGNRMTNIQFQDVEAEIVSSTGGQDPLIISFDNGNPEYTNDDKSLAAPHGHFEVSEFTDHQTNQLFGDDVNPVMREITDQLDINFSVVAPLGDGNFEVMQKNIDQEKKRANMSIDVDFNATHFSLKADESGVSDMSITDTIHSPKVAASKVAPPGLLSSDRKSNIDDWVADKENIIVNPYVAPLPADNFAVSDDNDDVLVFDGKKCKFQSDLGNKAVPNPPASIVSAGIKPESSNKRRTIVYNSDQGDISVTEVIKAQIILPTQEYDSGNKTINNTFNNDSNISMTQAVPDNILISCQKEAKCDKQKTIHFDDLADISVTQALPSNIIGHTSDERRKTIVYENNEGHLSITEAIPANIMIAAVSERRRTILYENEDADISMTQAIPINILQVEKPVSERSNTVVYNDDAINITQDVPANVLLACNPEKRKTILFENDAADISMTQVIPTNLILPDKRELDKRRTIVYEDDGGNISVTQAVPANLLLDKSYSDKRKTIVYENDAGNMSVTQTVPNKVILQEIQNRLQVLQDKSVADMNITQGVPTKLNETDATNKRETIVFDDNQWNVSVTQSLPGKIMVQVPVADKRKTIIYQDAAADISVTQTVPTNLIQKEDYEFDDINTSNKTESRDIVPERKQAVLFDNEHTSLNRTGLSDGKMEITRKSILCDADDKDVDMSITQAILNRENNSSNESSTILDGKLGNLSMSKPIPAQMMSIHSDLEEKSKNEEVVKRAVTYDATINKSIIEHQDIFIYEAAIKYTKSEQERELATESGDVLETFLSKIGESASGSTVSQTSGKTEAISEPNASINAENMELQLLDGEENKSSAVSVIEKSINSSSRHSKLVDNPISIKESILNDLLDMSDQGTEDAQKKKQLIETISNASSENATGLNNERGSKESYLIIKDSDEEQADKKSSASDQEQADKKSSPSDEKTPLLENSELLPIEYQDEKRHGIVGKLQHKLGELKTFINQKTSPKNKHISSDLENVAQQETTDKNESKYRPNDTKADKTANNADDTNALLDMLSHFTDTRVSRDFSDDKKEPSPIKVKGLIAIENKTEENQPRRSLVPNRKSMVRSREDLLKDISMAQAMIKYVDEEDDVMNGSAEETAAESQEEQGSPPRRAAHVSNEVVKTLKFDEEDSIYEINTRQEMSTTPLKKTAFGETTYIEDHIRDSKTKVIPGFLQNVADNLKELMSDLVKPVADVNPFETNLDRDTRKTASTCSTHVQANLLTSSQIDLDPELESNAHSTHSMEERLASEVAAIGNESIARALQSEIIHTGSHFTIPESGLDDPSGPASPPRQSESHTIAAIRKPRPQVPAGRVLVFDRHNPLNNVLLPAIDRGEVHKYNPGVPDSLESLVPEPSETAQAPEPSEREPQHDVESRIALHDTVMPAGDAAPPPMPTAQSFSSNTSKPMSLDESIDVKQDVKDIEVNTMIVMKRNRELLDASSSLTLVDDALARSAYDVEIDSNSPLKKGRSPVQVIFKLKEPESSVKLDSDLTSNDDDMSEVHSKGKKRNYSPAQPEKHCTFATEEVTPKPATKMQKVSITPKIKKMLGISQPTKLYADKQHDRAQQCATSVEAEESSQGETSSQESDTPPADAVKSKRKSKQKELGTSITVQQLLTEYNMDTKIDQVALNREILAALSAKAAKSEASCSTTEPGTTSNTEECKSLDVVSSFASSRRNFHSEPSDSEGLGSADSGRRGNWQPELMHEMSSKNLVTECESSVNVVAKIDVLPFMGTTDCEWESRGADSWSFRLLRARLRLLVRLQHRHGNAPRSRVRADTPVLLVAVDQPAVDNKNENPIATLCVRFAAEAMRYFVSRGCARAGDVPALLRRCAGVARVAVRWGRAMHAARQHLAFTLSEDGALSLKVANIPLRSVWEVSLRLELVVADAREAPWPRAVCVRVARVVAEQPVGAAELRRLLAGVPRDWGHAPRAVWKIFRYLKRKTRDDDLLLGL